MTSFTLLAAALLLATLLIVVLRPAGPWGAGRPTRWKAATGRRLAAGLGILVVMGLLLAAWQGGGQDDEAAAPRTPGRVAPDGRGIAAESPTNAPPAPAGRLSTQADALAATAAALAQTTAERRRPPATPGAATGAAAAPDIDALLARLQQRLEQQPGDADGWAMLAHSNASLERYADAAKAYARAAALRPQDAQLKADWADAAAMAQGGTARGEPTRLLEEALALDPRNVKARVMAGLAALERSDVAGARRHFESAAAAAPAASPIAKAMRERLAALPPADPAR